MTKTRINQISNKMREAVKTINMMERKGLSAHNGISKDYFEGIVAGIESMLELMDIDYDYTYRQYENTNLWLTDTFTIAGITTKI